MKKSICKGDKKKKKDVTEEISCLEEALDKKQEEELARWKVAHLNINNTENNSRKDNGSEETKHDKQCEQPMHRVSKAQRRRDKKANAERERNQRIIEEEALNVFGKRNVELQTIKKILLDRDLMIYEIPSDGHWYVIFCRMYDDYRKYLYFYINHMIFTVCTMLLRINLKL